MRFSPNMHIIWTESQPVLGREEEAVTMAGLKRDSKASHELPACGIAGMQDQICLSENGMDTP